MTGRNSAKDGEGFYEASLTEAERRQLPKAREVEGLDEEVAMLRTRLFAMAQQKPERVERLMNGMGMLLRAMAVRYRISEKSQEDLEASIAGVLDGVGRTMGLGEYRDAAEG